MRTIGTKALLGVLGLAGWWWWASPAPGTEVIPNVVTVATVKERDVIPAPADGYTVLLKATGNFHRWNAANKIWEILNESNVVNVKDFGASGAGANADDTDAIERAFQYAATHELYGHGSLRGNATCPVTIFFPPGTYLVSRPISKYSPLQGTSLSGNGAKLVGVGKRETVFFDTSSAPGIVTRISGLTFENFKNVIKCWVPKPNNAWAGWVTFENCRFSGGDYVMVSYCSPNVYVNFNGITVETCNLFKGMSDSVFISNLTGMTKNTMDGSPDGKPWSGGWCEGGGVEDGIEAGQGARFFVNNIMCSPIGVEGTPAADQSWFKLSAPGSMVVLNACRFGGEYGGIPLVKNLVSGTYVVSATGVEHHSTWRPRYIFDAFPQNFSESGMGGTAFGGILGASPESMKDGLKGTPAWQTGALNDSRMRLLDEMARTKNAASIAFLNYNPMPYNPVGKSSTQDDYEVFHGYANTVNVTSSNVRASFEGLKGKRYAIKDADKFKKFNGVCSPEQTQFCARLFFETVPDRLYNVTFFYRSQGVKTINFTCAMPDNPVSTTAWLEMSKLASVADSRGGLAQGTLSFYVERPGLHALCCEAKFDDATGFVEIYPIAITDGPFDTPYLSGPRWAGPKQEPEPALTEKSYYSQHQTTLHFMGPAAPKQGAWRKGSIVYNNNPAPELPVGWICTEDGQPGVWCPFGLIGKPLTTAEK